MKIQMSETEKAIKAYLHKTYYGCEISKDKFDMLAQYLIDTKIVNTNDLDHIRKIINKYAVYSKKKDRYYFITNNIIRIKRLPPPQ